MQDLTVVTHWVRIYISGPIDVAKQVLREAALPGGLCVTVEPTSFIYAGGEEAGVVVGLVNYPRFPENPIDIDLRAHALMRKLLQGMHQHSALLMTPTFTRWISVREDVTAR